MSFTDTTGAVTTYGYDAAGNRTSVTDASGTVIYTVDAAGQLVADSTGVSYAYDAAGNLTGTSDGDVYGYDAYGRTVSTTADGVSQTYAYDGDHVRVEVDGVAQLWDRTAGLPTLIETDGGDVFTHGPTGIHTVDGDHTLVDAIGSVRATVNGTGITTGTATFDPFGEGATAGVFGFAGEQHDPTGLVHLRARQYDPGLGRFTAFDPVTPGGPGTGGYNHYSYAGNNPTTWTDPSGRLVDGATRPPTLLREVVTSPSSPTIATPSRPPGATPSPRPVPQQSRTSRGGGGPLGEYLALVGIGFGVGFGTTVSIGLAVERAIGDTNDCLTGAADRRCLLVIDHDREQQPTPVPDPGEDRPGTGTNTRSPICAELYPDPVRAVLATEDMLSSKLVQLPRQTVGHMTLCNRVSGELHRMAAAQYPLRDGQTLEPLVTRLVGIDGPHAEIKLLDESGAQAASLERLSIGTGNNFCSACLLRLNQEGAVLIGVFGRDRGDKRAIWPAA